MIRDVVFRNILLNKSSANENISNRQTKITIYLAKNIFKTFPKRLTIFSKSFDNGVCNNNDYLWNVSV